MAGSPAFCGINVGKIYEAGGTVLIGELVAAYSVAWNRVRDEISTASITVSIEECCELLEQIEPVAFELHIERDGELVWCGVITRMEFEWDRCDIFAEDMLWVTKRRVVENGFDYRTYPQNIDAPQGPDPGNPSLDPPSQSQDAVQVAANLLEQCYTKWPGDIWGMEGHVLPVDGPANCNPRTAGQVNDFSETIWDTVDKMAEDNGLDYCTVARDIYLFDNNLNFDEIAPLMPGDVSDYPRIVEYGNGVATRFFRTNGSGWAGVAEAPQAMIDRYAPDIDILSSENTQAQLTTEDPIPPPSNTTLANWNATAARRITGKYPVRRAIVVPANSTLMPTSPWDINTLRPGVWFEVTVDRACRGEVTEYNRLHKLQVRETGGGPEDVGGLGGGEQVQIITIQPPSFMLLQTDDPCDVSTGLPTGASGG